MTVEEPGSDGDDSVARHVFGDRFVLAQAYHALLAGEGIEWGLIGPREVDRLWSRHLLNSAAIADLVPQGAEVVDIGSGAGLPGIPLALAREDVAVTLLEPLQRRVNFLELAVERLDLEERLAVQRGRAEEFEGAFDVVTCRAVAPLRRLVEWCLPLLGPGGSVVALKGASAAEEVRGTQKQLQKLRLRAEVLTVRAHPAAEPTTAVRLTRA